MLQPQLADKSTQASPSSAAAVVGSVLDAKLEGSQSETFRSLLSTQRFSDHDLRERSQDIMDELKEICDEQNQDTSLNSIHQAFLRSSLFTVSAGYQRAEEQPSNIRLQLRSYQCESLAWMIDREKQRSLNDPFWIPISGKDRDDAERTLYYCPLTGALSTVPPPPVVGGVLAEEMGLGKTIIAISLIDSTFEHARQSRYASVAGHRSDLISSGATLVVCPVTLLKQWEQEFRTKLRNPLRVLTWYGARTKDSNRIAGYDVVLTTYGVLSCNNYDSLTKIHWYRLIIDESTYLRGGANNCATVLNYELVSSRRWAISGTPFGNHLPTFLGTMRFLGVVPFPSSKDFDFITSTFNEAALRNNAVNTDSIFLVPRLAYVLKSLVIRHVKDQEFRGSALVELPPASGRLVKVKADCL
ncbi:SNF2-like [Gracilaria domingensis]|nr:SNF2-like [Gracilaria domingensis]